MKKKVVVIVLLALAITLISTYVVLAQDSGENGSRSMFVAMKLWLDDAKTKGELTSEEAQMWDEHFAYMETAYKKNGAFGHCLGARNFDSNSANKRYRHGMMLNF